jgi:hypothetical protein
MIMIKKLASITISCLALQIGLHTNAFCGIANEIESRTVEVDKIKAQISEISTKPNHQVEVVLTDKRKLKGVITETSDNSFIIRNKKNLESLSVQYSQVQKVKAQQLSTKATVIIGIALIVGIVVVAAVSLPE